MLGAVNEISAIPGWSNDVDARGCRQPTTRGDGCGAIDIPSAVDALVTARQAGLLGGVVVIQVGNNGPMSDAQFDQVMAQVADQPLVFWLTLHEPRYWESSNNAVMFNGMARWANLRVLDWHALSEGQPWFSDSEGIHLNRAGAQAMADLIASALPPDPFVVRERLTCNQSHTQNGGEAARRAYRKRSSAGGRTSSAWTSPRRNHARGTPRTTAAGQPVALPMTSSAAPASSSTTATSVTCISRP